MQPDRLVGRQALDDEWVAHDFLSLDVDDSSTRLAGLGSFLGEGNTCFGMDAHVSQLRSSRIEEFHGLLIRRNLWQRGSFGVSAQRPFAWCSEVLEKDDLCPQGWNRLELLNARRTEPDGVLSDSKR